MKKFLSTFGCFLFTGLAISATAAEMVPATVASGPQNGGEYLDAQQTIVLTWDGSALGIADASLAPRITIYQKGFEDDPDFYTFGEGTWKIVDCDGGTDNALELDLSGYTSSLDFSTGFPTRKVKLGEYVITLREGFLRNAGGDLNPQQTITFVQTENTNGIGVIVANDEVIYYDLSGKQITNPEKGKIVIRVSNGKTEKIVK